MRALAFVLLISAPAAVAAPVPKELKKTGGLEEIGGAWVHPSDGSGWKLEADGTAAIHNAGWPPKDGIRFAIDSNADPKTFDWIAPWGQYYGVYELKGDTLTLYLSNLAKEKRHRELKAGPGVEVYGFKRQAVAK